MTYSRACNCIGPQKGQPRCPCMMRGVQEVDGRYVKIEDLGPVKHKEDVPCLYKQYQETCKPEYRNKPLLLSCPCPNCSPYSMSKINQSASWAIKSNA